MGELAGQRFAVIVDEAHSSQSGEGRKSVHEVLTVKSLADEAGDDEEAALEDDLEDLLLKEAGKRKMPANAFLTT
jgi:type I restriction enzyme R subunit